ncbi:hypothetical protein SARC_09770, partial [Sphaeroforma arctica JP610]
LHLYLYVYQVIIQPEKNKLYACTRLHSNVESPHLPYTWTRAHAHHFTADTMDLVDDAEHWMQSMYAILKERRLIDVRMPGTHHSDSHPFKGHIPIVSYIDRKLSKCQGCSIEFQLKNGMISKQEGHLYINLNSVKKHERIMK